MSVRTVCLIAVLAFSEAAGQQSSVVPIGPPFGSANQLVSPDGALGLFGIDQVAQLWLEDIRTRRRRLVLTATVQTLTVAWSPESAAFIVNDRETSDLEFAYVYDSKTLDRLDLRGRILVTDPKAVRFVPGVKTAPIPISMQSDGWTLGKWSCNSTATLTVSGEVAMFSPGRVLRPPLSRHQGWRGAEALRARLRNR